MSLETLPLPSQNADKNTKKAPRPQPLKEEGRLPFLNHPKWMKSKKASVPVSILNIFKHHPEMAEASRRNK